MVKRVSMYAHFVTYSNGHDLAHKYMTDIRCTTIILLSIMCGMYTLFHNREMYGSSIFIVQIQ